MWTQGPYVGTSGFSYKSFVGPLYPRGLPQTRWLDHYITAFNTVELCGTFYNMPKPATVAVWRDKPSGSLQREIAAFWWGTRLRRCGKRRIMNP